MNLLQTKRDLVGEHPHEVVGFHNLTDESSRRREDVAHAGAVELKRTGSRIGGVTVAAAGT